MSILETLQHFQPGIVTSFGQVVAAKSIVAVKPLALTPPRVPEAKQQGPRPGMFPPPCNSHS